MARIRSPGYPNSPLEQVIGFADKVHSEDRQHPVDRATVARHIGFTGLSGTSDRALSALMHFGLMEKVKKGELRVTDLALRILHPDNPAERRVALHEAAFSPELFRELRARYSDAPPSRESLSSYLSRTGFAPAAIGSATRAYLETCSFLQREGAYESGGTAPPAEAESLAPIDEEPQMQTPQPSSTTPTPTPSAPVAGQSRTLMSTRQLDHNEVYLDFRGSHEVHVEGILDLNGILDLEEKLKAVKMLLKAPFARAVDDDDTAPERSH